MIIIFLLLFIILLLIFMKCKLSDGVCKNSNHLIGKVVIVTGGNSGIGYETALDLAQRGARVILTSRNEINGITTRDEIINKSGNKDVHFLLLELLCLDSIRSFANIIVSNEKRLDILINNAGAYYESLYTTKDGLQSGMQTNYFGVFLLTNLLLPLLVTSAPSRIINVSSDFYKFGNVDVDDLNMVKVSKKRFARHFVYFNAKLCIALMTVELDRRLKDTGVTANFLHPGWVATNIIKAQGFNEKVKKIRVHIDKIVKSPRIGAQTTIHLATSLDLQNVSGKYFIDCREENICQKAKDLVLARNLWEKTNKLVNL